MVQGQSQSDFQVLISPVLSAMSASESELLHDIKESAEMWKSFAEIKFCQVCWVDLYIEDFSEIKEFYLHHSFAIK